MPSLVTEQVPVTVPLTVTKKLISICSVLSFRVNVPSSTVKAVVTPSALVVAGQLVCRRLASSSLLISAMNVAPQLDSQLTVSPSLVNVI